MLKNLFWYCILIFSCFSRHNCILVITSEENERPMLDAHFVIPNLNLSSVETMTLCGRFKTHQFTVAKEVSNDGILESIDDIVQGIFPALGTISKCPHLDQKCKLFLNEAHASQVFFFESTVAIFEVDTIGKIKFFPTWTPNAWNSFCLKMNSTGLTLKINQDVIVDTKTTDDSYIRYCIICDHTQLNKEDLIFMNTKHLRSPMFGAFTDINVWNKTLSDEEEGKWADCVESLEGNVFGWKEASSHGITVKGLRLSNVSSDNICPKRFNRLIVSDENVNFHDTLIYCNKIGNMADISSNETAHEVSTAFQTYFRNGPHDTVAVFSLYTDLEHEGEWVHQITKEEMKWNNWESGEPNSWMGGEDCSGLIFFDMRPTTMLYDIPCSINTAYNRNPACNMAEGSTFNPIGYTL